MRTVLLAATTLSDLEATVQAGQPSCPRLLGSVVRRWCEGRLSNEVRGQVTSSKSVDISVAKQSRQYVEEAVIMFVGQESLGRYPAKGCYEALDPAVILVI